MEDFRIDQHKLIFHVDRVNAWRQGRLVAPLYMEIAPSGGCNHRCIFCALDYLKYQPIFLPTQALLRTIRQAGRMGVRSIMYAGEGEPLLHRDIVEIVRATRRAKIDTAITTNGVLLTPALGAKIVKYLSWIRFSINAGKAATYAQIHRCHPRDFVRVMDNLKAAVAIKRREGLATTIGVQFLLLPQNASEAVTIAAKVKRIGVDYLTIKPYSQHPLSGSRIDPKFRYEKFFQLADILDKMEGKHFRVVFRQHTMDRLRSAKEYRRCLGLPFWAYIDAHGDVYACSAFLGDRRFCFGNIVRSDFKAIMAGKRRRDLMRWAATCMDVSECRRACRLDKINSYLWELKHPGPHVNFI